MLATAAEVWVGVIALLLAGAGTMGTINVLFSNYTLRLETWMRGRGSALAMLMVWLGASVGAVAWGALASGVGVRTTLLVAAAANVGAALAARLLLTVRPVDPTAFEPQPAVSPPADSSPSAS